MKKISKDIGNADTDTSRDYEYTDWNESDTSPRSSWRSCPLSADSRSSRPNETTVLSNGFVLEDGIPRKRTA
jgi:hypothetical protein